ncbi:MAG: hypothetical protein B6242_17280 [Anaerolineaceae bacterium 4572_78]|nr:MAG: hypothetical protein B6242_17280 [Anaerolineaceae bacterium 4572_78]
MKNLCLSIMLAIAIIISACNNQPVTPTNQATSNETPVTQETSPEIDLTQLSQDVDLATVDEIRGRDDVILIDVREQWEYDNGHIPGVMLMPTDTIPNRLSDIPKDKTVIIYCRSGRRSANVIKFLRQNSFDNIHNMLNGFAAWEKSGYEIEY